MQRMSEDEMFARVSKDNLETEETSWKDNHDEFLSVLYDYHRVRMEKH